MSGRPSSGSSTRLLTTPSDCSPARPPSRWSSRTSSCTKTARSPRTSPPSSGSSPSFRTLSCGLTATGTGPTGPRTGRTLCPPTATSVPISPGSSRRAGGRSGSSAATANARDSLLSCGLSRRTALTRTSRRTGSTPSTGTTSRASFTWPPPLDRTSTRFGASSTTPSASRTRTSSSTRDPPPTPLGAACATGSTPGGEPRSSGPPTRRKGSSPWVSLWGLRARPPTSSATVTAPSSRGGVSRATRGLPRPRLMSSARWPTTSSGESRSR